MDFFEAQDNARRTSNWLIVVFIPVVVVLVALVTFIIVPAYFLVVVGIVQVAAGEAESLMSGYRGIPREVFLFTALITTLIIIIASLFKRASLSSGGGAVAAAQGGTPLVVSDTDPLAHRLRNVVEEMAIASGVPVPEIYVLEREASINAFAAGFTTGDAAIVVTRGALESLDRDELQGVIAHEFSHILNGDMRLFMRMLGLLYGISFIALIGRTILRAQIELGTGAAKFAPRIVVEATRAGASEGPKGCLLALVATPIILIFSIVLLLVLAVVSAGLALLGSTGQLISRAIKGAVSRQREYLADASSVQFTRQTDGIVGALRKIGGYNKVRHSMAMDPEEVSHMLFSNGSKAFAGIATHPPLTDRIKALDPTFDKADYPVIAATSKPQAIGEEESVAPLTAGIALTRLTTTILPESIAESVGQPESAHVEYARKLRASIPEDLYSAAHSVGQSYLLTLALILDRSGHHLEHQMNLLEEHMGVELTGLLRNYQERVTQIDAEYRLPLLELAFPALKRRPAVQLVELTELANRLVQSDGEIDLYEFCFYRILLLNLGHALDPLGDSTRRRGSRLEVAQAAVNVVAIVAQNGHKDPAEAQAALDAGTALLGKWAANARIDSKQELTADALDKSLDLLLQVNGKGRRKLLLAICEAAAHDGRLNATEGELIRVICATLDCPMPPILVDDSSV
jgi:Zn-dependent protease with chaperone function